MPILREVVLQRRDCVRDEGEPTALIIRIYDHTNNCGGGWYELRGEDGSGNVRFAFRDDRKLLIFEEFDETVNELMADYRVVERPRAAHG